MVLIDYLLAAVHRHWPYAEEEVHYHGSLSACTSTLQAAHCALRSALCTLHSLPARGYRRATPCVPQVLWRVLRTVRPPSGSSPGGIALFTGIEPYETTLDESGANRATAADRT